MLQRPPGARRWCWPSAFSPWYQPCTGAWRQILKVSYLLNFPSASLQPSPRGSAASGLAPGCAQGWEGLTIQLGIPVSENFIVAPQSTACWLPRYLGLTLKLCHFPLLPSQINFSGPALLLSSFPTKKWMSFPEKVSPPCNASSLKPPREP